jgi:nitrite reductase/ring-hydroxylating ferredoxin subunit
VAGAALLVTGGWLGGTLVYRNQIGVDHRYADAGKWQPRRLPPPADPAAPIDLGADDQLNVNQMALLRIGDRRIALARTERGYVAFDDRCTHKGGPLSDGTLACGTVQCPWHGSQFDVHGGAVQHGPADQAIGSYEVAARDGRLFLSLSS